MQDILIKIKESNVVTTEIRYPKLNRVSLFFITLKLHRKFRKHKIMNYTISYIDRWKV